MPLAYLPSIKSTKLSRSQVWLASPKKCVIEIYRVRESFGTYSLFAVFLFCERSLDIQFHRFDHLI